MIRRLLTYATLAVALTGFGQTIEPDVDDFSIWEVADSAMVCITDTAECMADTIQPILGPLLVDAATMHAFVLPHNPDFPFEIAEAYFRLGELYGIRADVAFCQAILETGWFRFEGGTAVTPDQHNYCGLGVLERGMKGHSFPTIDDGVRAQLQHLYAYATRDPLPQGEEIVDPRFKLVSRGCATNWHDLANRWAQNPIYGHQILGIYERMLALPQPDPQP